eukprot:NODE_4329_length_826_cov_212.750322_g4001_i0.p1 GENE.NODE_4329_length_826_cov_212.750322_g4001_i0~~NODE_4329_length_826_cov_212.750322_g4001_i0.p1  ORF type:complete len:180 (-),score=23.51 NODE_4329_length_826_cov_212.750322_g4001_i0:211-750(-)
MDRIMMATMQIALVLLLGVAVEAGRECCSCRALVDHIKNGGNCTKLERVEKVLCLGHSECIQFLGKICTEIDSELKKHKNLTEVCGPHGINVCPGNLTTVATTNGPASPRIEAPQFCGKCGLAYQSCCIAYKADGFPCNCHLSHRGDPDTCGDCGCAYEWCCGSTQTNPLGGCSCSLGP